MSTTACGWCANGRACLARGGFVPARKDALGAACPPQQVADAELPQDDAPPAFREQYTGALHEALGDARLRPVTPYYGHVTRDIQNTLHPWPAAGGGRPPPSASWRRPWRSP